MIYLVGLGWGATNCLYPYFQRYFRKQKQRKRNLRPDCIMYIFSRISSDFYLANFITYGYWACSLCFVAFFRYRNCDNFGFCYIARKKKEKSRKREIIVSSREVCVRHEEIFYLDVCAPNLLEYSRYTSPS